MWDEADGYSVVYLELEMGNNSHVQYTAKNDEGLNSKDNHN